MFRMEDGYSLEKFHSSILVDLSCQLQSWEKICNLKCWICDILEIYMPLKFVCARH